MFKQIHVIFARGGKTKTKININGYENISFRKHVLEKPNIHVIETVLCSSLSWRNSRTSKIFRIKAWRVYFIKVIQIEYLIYTMMTLLKSMMILANKRIFPFNHHMLGILDISYFSTAIELHISTGLLIMEPNQKVQMYVN